MLTDIQLKSLTVFTVCSTFALNGVKLDIPAFILKGHAIGTSFSITSGLPGNHAYTSLPRLMRALLGFC